MAARECVRQQHLELLEQARRREPVQGVGVVRLLLLVAPHEETPLEDLDPICWRVNARFGVDRTQAVIFLRAVENCWAVALRGVLQ